MNYRLIALDLDGTLYNDRKEITPATLNALRDAQDSGIRLMISSARPVPGLYRSRDALDMERHDGIVDQRIRAIQPGDNIRIDPLQLVEIDLRPLNVRKIRRFCRWLRC